MSSMAKQSIADLSSYRRLETLGESLSAINDMIGIATGSIKIFDFSLAEYGFNSRARVEQLNRFLMGSRKRRIDIVVHQTTYLERDAPRMINLLRTHSHCISISKTTHAARHAMDAFIIADEHSYWHRLHIDHARSVAAINDPQGTGGLLLRFSELVEASEPGISASTIGL
jgi:hypothetical protein